MENFFKRIQLRLCGLHNLPIATVLWFTTTNKVNVYSYTIRANQIVVNWKGTDSQMRNGLSSGKISGISTKACSQC